MSGKMSTPAAVIAVVSSTLGTGILAMPYAFHCLGYVYGLLAITFFGLITWFSLYSLAYSAIATEEKGEASYPKLAASFSKPLKVLVDFATVGSSVGCGLFFTRLFAEKASNILKNNIELDYELETIRKFLVVFIVLVSMFFFTKKNLSSLAFISYISIAAAAFYTILCFYYGIAHGKSFDDLLPTNTNYGEGISKFVFALHCQFSFLSIYNELEDKSLANVSKACIFGSILSVLIYATAGFFGYRAIGQDIANFKNILDVFIDSKNAFTVYVKENTFDKSAIMIQLVAYSFLFIFFGAIIFNAYPIFPILQNYLSFSEKPASRSFVIILVGIFLFSFGFPQKDYSDSVLDIIANIFTNALSFVFPSIFMIEVSPKMSISSIFSYLLIGFSFALMVNFITKLIA